MSDEIRPKRKGHQQWAWGEKIYIPCPLHTKNAFARLARESGMSQAELGLVILERAMERRQWLEEAIKTYRGTERGF